MDRELSCAERIEAEYLREREILLAVTGMLDMPAQWYEDDDYDSSDIAGMIDSYRERVLAFDVKNPDDYGPGEDYSFRGVSIPYGMIAVDVEMSTGGPADGFILATYEGEVMRAWYYFQDRFDKASMRVSPDCLDALNEVWGGFAC